MPETKGSIRVCLFGTFDPETPRSRLMVRWLSAAGFEVHRCHIPVWKPNERASFYSRRPWRIGLRILSAYPRILIRFLRAPRPALIVVLYPGYLDMFLGRFLGRLIGVPVVYDVFLSLYDTVVSDRRLYSERSVVGRLTLWLDRCSCRMADLILVDTPQNAEFFSRMARLPLERFRVLWVGADQGRFRPQPEIKPVDHRVLFYGTFIPVHGVQTIVRAAQYLETDGIRIRLIGQGQDSRSAQQLAKELGVANVEFLDSVPVPYDQLPEEIAGAPLCLGIFGSSSKAQRSVPFKVFECIAMGRPVLTADTPAIRAAFEPGEEIAVCRVSDPAALAGAIRDLVNDPARCRAIAASGHTRFLRDYSEPALCRTLRRHLLELLGRKGG